eukprot:scaffold2612_cov267-Chaetoceros_neogracile.AAC.64
MKAGYLFCLYVFGNFTQSSALSSPGKTFTRRDTLQSIFFAGTLAITPSDSNAATDEGISAITDSSIGKTFRRSAIQGARVADSLDEKWERFSDSLRDKNKCDDNTGRRLYDNGFRKDGSRIGNPVLGGLCKPEPLLPLDQVRAYQILAAAEESAVSCGVDGAALKQAISAVEILVRPSFERNIQSSTSEEEKVRKSFDFALYTRMRAISNILNGSAATRNFQLAWGGAMLSQLAPSANRKDYVSPIPEAKDEFEDYDYDKGRLLDALGALKVSLDSLKSMGLIGYPEISIPYDDYGSVVTIAIDDYVPIGAEMLLVAQNYAIGGPGQALVRAAIQKAGVLYNLDTFYLDPSTTKQNEFNPSQLLLSVSNLRKI